MQAKRTQDRKKPSLRLTDAVVGNEVQSFVSSSGCQRSGRVAGGTTMTAAIVRDSADKGRQLIDRRLIGRTRRVMLVRRHMLTMESGGFGVPVVRTEIRTHRPARRKHGQYADNRCADAPLPQGVHDPSISSIRRFAHHR